MPTLIGTWADSAARNTPTAGNGVVIEATASVYRQDDGACKLSVHAQITNHTLLDAATGAVIVSLLSGGNVVSSLLCTTERCPGRGLPWNPATVRTGDNAVTLAAGLSFDQVGFKIFNSDHDGEPVDFTQLIGLVASVLLP